MKAAFRGYEAGTTSLLLENNLTHAHIGIY
jgi:hypothetical protein